MSLSRMESYIINLAAKVAELERRIRQLEARQPRPKRLVDVVWQAQRDIERIVSEVKDRYGHCYRFVVNQEKRTVVALLNDGSGKILARGIAKCHPKDVFVKEIGMVIALYRAEGMKVLDEYLNPPKPSYWVG